MITQLTRHAAVAHNAELLHQATAARRTAALHHGPSLRGTLKRLKPRRRGAAHTVISAPRLG
jgi:hypothetical protein